MARVSLSLVLLGCTLLQYTLAEFGSLGTVLSSQSIKSTVDSTTTVYDETDDKNGLLLKTDYTLFSTVLPLMESLGTQVQVLGTTLTNTISASVPNNSGNLDSVFNPIQAAVTQFIAFIDGEQAATRTTLTEMLGSDIDHLFGDVFGNTRLALLEIQTSFTRLQQALQTARVRNGRAIISATVVASVLTAVNNLRATAFPVQYTVYTTIENIEMGDMFLYDLEEISVTLISNLQQYLSDFREDLVDLGFATEDEQEFLSTEWSEITGGIGPVTSNLGSLAEYSTFDGALTSLGSTYNKLLGIDDSVIGTFTTYLNTAATYLTQYQEVLVPRDYLSITYVLEVIIAGGAHARFCFFKFFPRLTNYYSNLAYNVEDCFNEELVKLDSLYYLARALVELILFDLEDLLDNLTVCNESSAPGDCIGSIGPYYVELFAKTDFKVGFFEQFVAAEARASVNRLGACIFSRKLFNMQRLFTATTDIQACRTDGPDAPDLGE
uniref:Protein TsetseEP domain-containing protein n=1 Tax=Anopheles atroparvus TaxID=41427 RepID=A0A182IXA2_ANOAO